MAWTICLARIFVSDMSDSLSAAVPFEYLLEEIVKPASDGPGRRHDWPWLTKRPREMAKFASWLTERGIQWPDNLWAGTSVTSIQSTNRISNLLLVGSATTTRFVSVEPQAARARSDLLTDWAGIRTELGHPRWRVRPSREAVRPRRPGRDS